MRNLEVTNNQNGVSLRQISKAEGKRASDSYTDLDRKSRKRSFSNDLPQTVEISWMSFIKVLFLILALFLIYKLFPVISILFFAFVISCAALPAVRFFQTKGFSRTASVLLTYIIGLAFFILTSTLILIPFIEEIKGFSNDLPNLYENLVNNIVNVTDRVPYLEINEQSVREALDETIDRNLQTFSPDNLLDDISKAFDRVTSVGGAAASVLFTVVLSIYIVIDHDTFIDIILLRFPERDRRNLVRNLVNDVENKLGRWLVGQGTLSLIVGVAVYICLKLLDIPFALPLAVLAAALESVPNVGPIVASVPAIIVAFLTKDLTYTGLVAAVYIVVQQLENNFIVPRVMGNAVGLKPLVVMIGVLTGFTLFGVIGAVLSVPVLVIGKIAFEFYRGLQKLKALGKV